MSRPGRNASSDNGISEVIATEESTKQKTAGLTPQITQRRESIFSVLLHRIKRKISFGLSDKSVSPGERSIANPKALQRAMESVLSNSQTPIKKRLFSNQRNPRSSSKISIQKPKHNETSPSEEVAPFDSPRFTAHIDTKIGACIHKFASQSQKLKAKKGRDKCLAIPSLRIDLSPGLPVIVASKQRSQNKKSLAGESHSRSHTQTHRKNKSNSSQQRQNGSMPYLNSRPEQKAKLKGNRSLGAKSGEANFSVIVSPSKQVPTMLLDKNAQQNLKKKSRNKAELSNALVSLLSAKTTTQKPTLFSSGEHLRSKQDPKRNSYACQLSLVNNSSVESMTRTGETIKDEAALPIKPSTARIKQDNSSPRHARAQRKLQQAQLAIKVESTMKEEETQSSDPSSKIRWPKAQAVYEFCRQKFTQDKRPEEQNTKRADQKTNNSNTKGKS